MSNEAQQKSPEQSLRELYNEAYENIVTDLDRLHEIEEAGDDPYGEFSDTLVELKFGAVWDAGSTSKEDRDPRRFWALITTGGPAVRVVGDINKYGEPENCRLEVQDWGHPWTDFGSAAVIDLDSWAQSVAGVYWYE